MAGEKRFPGKLFNYWPIIPTQSTPFSWPAAWKIFSCKMSRLGKEIPKNMEPELKRLFEEHGMEIEGPPLKI
jgi:hypothetical protein